MGTSTNGTAQRRRRSCPLTLHRFGLLLVTNVPSYCCIREKGYTTQDPRRPFNPFEEKTSESKHILINYYLVTGGKTSRWGGTIYVERTLTMRQYWGPHFNLFEKHLSWSIDSLGSWGPLVNISHKFPPQLWVSLSGWLSFSFALFLCVHLHLPVHVPNDSIISRDSYSAWKLLLSDSSLMVVSGAG